MNTIETLRNSTHKINLIICLIFIVVLTGCSKDDDPGSKEIVKSSEKLITSFVFLLTNNPIEVNVVATIDEENKTITATMPPDTDLTGLLPEVEFSELATIDRTAAQNFTAPVAYTVTAEDGSTTVYTVTITNLLTQRQILQVILDTNPGNTLGWDLQNTEDLGALEGVSTNTEGLINALDMGFKKLISIPSEIGQLTNLTILELRDNELSELPPVIGQLTNLETLSLLFNQLTSIPSSIGQLTSLKFLGLNSNNLTSLPPEIGQLTNLDTLKLPNNQLNELPPEIWQLVNLTYLTFEANEIDAVPTEIKQLVNLEVLSFSSNKLTSLPPEIAQLTNLTKLILGRNQLTSVPPEIGQLTKLEELYLYENQLVKLPPEIGFLTNLKDLDLRNNNITAIPISICSLSLFNDLTTDLDEGVTCETTSQKDALISIYSANPGNTLGWSVDNYSEVTFHDNGNPKNITMNNKNLTIIPSTIGELNALETLNANSNTLESLPSSLGSIESLNVLTFAGNQLDTVPPELGQLNNLALLSITDNPITSIPSEVCDLQVSNGGILTILTDPGEGCD